MNKLKKVEKTQFIIEIILLLIMVPIWIFVIKNDIYFSKITNMPCFIYYATGFYCPGCGGTRAVDYFLRLKLIKSVFYHPAVIVMFLMYIRSLISYFVYFVKKGKSKIKIINIGDIIILDFIILAWFIIRNVYVFILL